MTLKPVIIGLGDSLTWGETLGVPFSQHWPALLQRLLKGRGYDVRVRNFGRSGRTTAYTGTANMGIRFAEAWQFDAEAPPRIGIVWGGANDPGNSIATAATTKNLRAILMGWKFGADQVVDGQANLPDLAYPGQRKVVYTDGSTSGGAALPTGNAGLATIVGSVTGPTVWECRFGAAGELGWGRVAKSDTPATHIRRLVVVGMHYLNYSGGDTVSSAYAAYDAATGVRKGQIDAAAAEGAIYCDLHGYLKARIVAGLETQNSASWHVENGNQHLNSHGESLVAQCVMDCLAGQPGWLQALQN